MYSTFNIQVAIKYCKGKLKLPFSLLFYSLGTDVQIWTTVSDPRITDAPQYQMYRNEIHAVDDKEGFPLMKMLGSKLLSTLWPKFSIFCCLACCHTLFGILSTKAPMGISSPESFTLKCHSAEQQIALPLSDLLVGIGVSKRPSSFYLLSSLTRRHFETGFWPFSHKVCFISNSETCTHTLGAVKRTKTEVQC